MSDKAEASRPSPIRRLARSLRRIVLALGWVGLGAGYLGVVFALVWRDDPAQMSRTDAALTFAALLVEIFTFHAGLALLAFVVVGALVRSWRFVIASAPLLVWALAPGVWLAVRPVPEPPGAEAPVLTVLSANLLYGRTDAEALAALIERESPDVICLQEYTPEMHARLAPMLSATYEHVVTWQREDAFGQAVFSRLAFVGPTRPVPGVGVWDLPQTTVVVRPGGADTPGAAVEITNVHVLPPAGLANVAAQRQQVAWLAEDVSDRLARTHRPAILAGDFNAPIWTAHLRELRGAGLRGAHAAAGEGGLGARGSTWPERGLARFAPGIRLDHVLFSRGLRCVESRVLEDVGSDHRPVLARFAVEGGGEGEGAGLSGG